MAFKPGDRVSLSVSPVIALGRFVNCKAHATLTRELGEDVDADLAEMEADLVPLYRRALFVELGELSQLQEIVGAPKEGVNWHSVAELVDYCIGTLNGSNEDQEEIRPPRCGGSSGPGKARKKAVKKEGKQGPRKAPRRRR